jgi:hypothetical protein
MASKSKVIVTKPEITEAAFVTKAISVLRKDGFKGAHVVYSGLNQAIAAQFPEQTAREITDALVASGVIVIQPCRGGAIAYIAGEQPERSDAARGKALAAKILAS